VTLELEDSPISFDLAFEVLQKVEAAVP
jgi:hypothetical protein